MNHVLIKKYDPLKKEMLEILDKDGKIINPTLDPKLDKETLLKMYKTMTLGRVADLRAVQYQRQGRMLTFAPNIGQEATQVGAAAAMQQGDWLSPAFRELNLMLYRGVPLSNIYLYWYGNENGSKFPRETNVLPVNIIIGSQIAIAAGIAMASKKQGKNEIALATIGDGGTSHGDFNEALNFAGAMEAPLVVLVQNNQWAISTPRSVATKAETIAQKAIAAGIKGIQVDGNDPLAMYVAMKEAREHALKTGPVLIEAVTYRIGAHTTSDDPSLYRDEKEVEEWKLKDPNERLKKYLISQKLWSEEEDIALDEENNKYVQEVFAETEKSGLLELEEVFKYTYDEMTPNQVEQYEYYKKFLEGSK
ncbi:pyruvate dehydrogenase (acetyl-transferring) E1 component subunit alpha [Haploplasma modicum]|uniref:pyruvate dehydrogenase (acetyl-transferring) E1 component subunit alpha n=1 Tax=Haploplasma modicum TaxID=2150 RepID=UPI00214C951E|nr:pyruvate dehydrogenase (acetyl-transferring) E1 component subunit alpha [Haploplasma modicum]MCR1809429.1 pyruvate dehydrogenase (acetyl-transferring) E1 component subunit alpha [Haploplasma modicum]